MRSFLINELEPVAYLVYLLALYLQYRQAKLVKYKVLCFYYFIAIVLLYAGMVITSIDNDWSYNLLFYINVCIFSWYFYPLLQFRGKQVVITACLVLNTILFIYTNFTENKFISGFNSSVYGIGFLSIIFYTFFYLYQSLSDIKDENPLLNFDFWLICGYLLYFLGSFVIVIYYDGATPQQRGNMWRIHNVILLICGCTALLAHIKLSGWRKKIVCTT